MNRALNRVYLSKSVLQAAQERVSLIFDKYKNVVVSVSGGKDSTVLFHLVHREAVRRNREVTVFFLDQEAEYQATIDCMRGIMRMPNVAPMWFQVPILMTNATSYEQDMLYAWGPGQKWMRDKEPNSIKEAICAPDRFYRFFDWFETCFDSQETAFLVGLRSEESLNRYRAVTRNPGLKGIDWSTKTKSGAVKFYPIYDWTFEDVWVFLAREGIVYNKVYDYLFVKEYNIPRMRVSNLIHEKAYRSLSTLQEFEPDTYNRLIERLKGVRTAALYAEESTVFSSRKLPSSFESWRCYRDFLMAQQEHDKGEIFSRRFNSQPETEAVHRQQVRQLLLNDYENSIPVVAKDDTDHLEKWRDLL